MSVNLNDGINCLRTKIDNLALNADRMNAVEFDKALMPLFSEHTFLQNSRPNAAQLRAIQELFNAAMMLPELRKSLLSLPSEAREAFRSGLSAAIEEDHKTPLASSLAPQGNIPQKRKPRVLVIKNPNPQPLPNMMSRPQPCSCCKRVLKNCVIL